MTALVTFQEATNHLRIDEATDDDEDIYAKMDMATDIVIDYIKRPNHGWTADTAPPLIKAAILLILTDLFENREPSTKEDLYLTKSVKNILHRYRDPAMA